MDNALSEDPKKPLDRLAQLAKFCTVFEKDSFQFGKWCGGGQDASGMYQDRYFQLSAGGKRFFELRWPPKLGQELAGVKIESRRLFMPGYAARSLVSDGITLPS
jgi:hypothetical protein